MRPSPKTRTLAQQLSSAFTLFGALVASAFLVTALHYGVALTWLTPEFERSKLAVSTESDAHAAMLDEENGLRAYLLTHEAVFLEPYLRGEQELARAHQALPAYVASAPALAGAMLGTRLAAELWRERWARPTADPRRRPVAVSLPEGKALFDAYRARESAFANALEQRTAVLAGRERRVIIVRVAFVLTVFILVLFFSVRQQRAVQDSIVGPVAALLLHIRRVRDGQFEATLAPAGPRELAELGEGLNEMVQALVSARACAASRDEALRHHSLRLRQILEASRVFSESLNLRYVVGAVRESTAAVGGYERVIVWLMDDEQKQLADADESAPEVSAEAQVAIGHGVAGRAARSGRIAFEEPDGQVRFGDGSLGPVCAVAIPLVVGARVVGALEARHAEAQVASTDAVEILEMLATHAATAIESARLHAIIEDRSQMDALTRLFNRRRLDEDLDAEVKRCTRYGNPLSFVMLDVDHFKVFNDTQGHPQADTALQELARITAACVRTTDTAYRYGGEEFCIILRETGAQEAMVFGERLRQRIEQRFASGGKAGLTASLGVATFSAETPSGRALIEAADAAMYESKHAGRNRVSLQATVSV